jgi:hypothetical protein
MIKALRRFIANSAGRCIPPNAIYSFPKHGDHVAAKRSHLPMPPEDIHVPA